jgi:dCTP deaminase
MCKEHNMIEPFLDHQVAEGKISYGLSSMGYDVRISDEYRIFTNVNNSLVDPKNFSDDNFIEKKGPYCIIPPNSFVLAKTVEYFRIPKDVLCICVGKSTYARTGIICNVTPIENEFEGNIVIELSNTTPNPAKIYSNEGIAQFLFFKSETQPETTYKSKNGKYQGQTTIQVAKIKK